MQHSVLSAAPSRSVQVIDPMNRTGKITVSLDRIQTTKGLEDHFAELADPTLRRRTKKDLSLCLLHCKGRCSAAFKCNQIHVEASFVEKLRAQSATGLPPCCSRHGDAPHQAPRHVSTVFVAGVMVPIENFAWTQALEALIAQGSAHIPASKVCRLQQDGRCKFGRDCKYVHVCREVFPKVFARDACTPPSCRSALLVSSEVMTPPLTAWARPVWQGDVTPSATSLTPVDSLAASAADRFSLPRSTMSTPTPPALTQWTTPARATHFGSCPPSRSPDRSPLPLSNDEECYKSMRCSDEDDDFVRFFVTRSAESSPTMQSVKQFVSELSQHDAAAVPLSPLVAVM